MYSSWSSLYVGRTMTEPFLSAYSDPCGIFAYHLVKLHSYSQSIMQRVVLRWTMAVQTESAIFKPMLVGSTSLFTYYHCRQTVAR
jgi:hypothetical protein